MARKFIAIICVTLVLLASSAHAMSRRIYTDEEQAHAKAVYTSCKKSITKETKPADFEASICYAHISGTMEGISATGLMYFFASSARITCTPNNPTVLEYARRYVAEVDARNKMYKHESYFFPAEVFSEIFNCEKTEQ